MASPDGDGDARRRPVVRRIMLRDFRSYATLDLAIDGRLIVLCGENGAGKTNLLEALSLLAPGRGLRRADLAECARRGGAGGFALSVEVGEDGAAHQLGTAWSPAKGGEGAERRHRIDRTPVASSRSFCDWLRLVWLTPAMDGLFAGAASERRRFLDRLVLAIDPGHGARVGKFERALRGRNRLLEEGARNPSWLDAIECEAAEIGVAVAAARLECVTRLQALIAAGRDETSPFPWAKLALQGEVEGLVSSFPALEAEDRYRALLRDNRRRDAAAGRTLVGPHVGDLDVGHGPKGATAASVSTGEQKALLVGLVLAHARLVADMSGIVPLALLDEIAAHFDPLRRAALFDALERIGAQVFLTGADWGAFAGLRGPGGDLRGLGGNGRRAEEVGRPSGVAGVGRQLELVDAQHRQRAVVFAGEIGVEDETRVGGAGQPAVGENLALELARAPAGIAERQHRAGGTGPQGDGAQDIDGCGHAHVFGDLDRRIVGAVIAGVKHEASSGLDRTAAQHPHLFGAGGQSDRFRPRERCRVAPAAGRNRSRRRAG